MPVFIRGNYQDAHMSSEPLLAKAHVVGGDGRIWVGVCLAGRDCLGKCAILDQMKSQNPSFGGPELEALRQRLSKLRDALLRLHKALVDSERVGYEKTLGKITSPNQFLHLLINDPWFAWLHPLSQLVAAMDEALGGKEPLTAAQATALVNQSSLLLAPAENGQEYARHYFEALQRDPDVVLAHAKAVKLAGLRKP
jgi:hypothetical protein